MAVIRSEAEQLDTEHIKFKDIPENLFDEIAEKAAKIIASNKNSNKISQLRKFYDELSMWNDKVHLRLRGKTNPAEQYKEFAPFIKMLNAKVTYAKGRNQKEDKLDPTVKDKTGLVDKNFVDLFSSSIRKIEDPKSLQMCKLFFEAFIGFYKVERPKD